MPLLVWAGHPIPASLCSPKSVPLTLEAPPAAGVSAASSHRGVTACVWGQRLHRVFPPLTGSSSLLCSSTCPGFAEPCSCFPGQAVPLPSGALCSRRRDATPRHHPRHADVTAVQHPSKKVFFKRIQTLSCQSL